MSSMITARENADKALDVVITKFLKERKPENVEQLTRMIQDHHNFSKEEIIKHVLLLKNEKKLSLKKTKNIFPSFRSFIISDRSAWFWIIAVLAFFTIVAVIGISENAFPFVYARYVLGILSTLFLPGYCFIRAVAIEKKLEYLEQIVFSLGLSIVFVFFIGIMLNFSPWGITLMPIVLGLSTLTLLFGVIALIREYLGIYNLKFLITTFLTYQITSTKLTILFLTFAGSSILLWVGWLTWYDITVWSKDIGQIFLGSRTDETIGLGRGIVLIHYCLIGVALLLSAMVLLIRKEIKH